MPKVPESYREAPRIAPLTDEQYASMARRQEGARKAAETVRAKAEMKRRGWEWCPPDAAYYDLGDDAEEWLAAQDRFLEECREAIRKPRPGSGRETQGSFSFGD